MPNVASKTCQNCTASFSVAPEDFVFYKRMAVPPPTWCPECRAIRRFSFWNERNLFRKKEAQSGKEVFSTYPQASPAVIYDHDYWLSDKWDPFSYGRDYDFSRPFFEQFRELLYAVPAPSRSVVNLVKSDYCNNVGDLKNCYLCFNGGIAKGKSEDCLYGVCFLDMRNSMDFYQCDDSELSYELFSVAKCYQAFFTIESNNCTNVWFCLNCENCSNCFGCVNLRHKQYHIFNKPYAKEDYLKAIKEFNLGSHAAMSEMKKKAHRFWKRFPMRYMHGTRNKNVTGDYVYQSKNVHYSYQCLEVEDSKYCQNMDLVNDSYDYTNWGKNTELVYEAVSSGSDCAVLKFCSGCWPGCENLEYCVECRSSSNLFGCVGLKKGEYAILNKRYPKKEYLKLRERIIAHMSEMPYRDAKGREYRYGEFFPPELSPFAYNESAAQDYFPKTKRGATEAGYAWREPETASHAVTKKAEELPDHIRDATRDVTKEIVECASCRKAYRIVSAELTFYKKFSLPLPHLCPNCRYLERIAFRNPMQWWKRTCQCAGAHSENGVYANTAKHFHKDARCPNTFETSYAPDRPEIVYCEQCYQGEVM